MKKSLSQEIADTLAFYEAIAIVETHEPSGLTIKTLKTLDPQSGYHFPLHFPDFGFSQPAMEFETKTGLRGVAGRYRLPDGVSSHDLQLYAMCLWHAEMRGDITPEAGHGRLEDVVAALKQDNPSLHALHHPASGTRTLYDIILGVASAYQPRDIQHFIDGNTWQMCQQDPRYKSLLDKIEQSTGSKMYWVPAYQTLQEVEAALLPAQKTQPQAVRHYVPK